MEAQSKFIDLLLPTDKLPKKFVVGAGGKKDSFFNLITELYKRDQSTKKPLLTKPENASSPLTPAFGTKETIYSSDDTGLFGTVFQAWANHWNIRTSAEDWWLPLITAVAKRVDDCADDEGLRKLFVNGRPGKELIQIQCPSFTIYDTDYTYLFNAFSKAISDKISVPSYVSAVSCDFSTTTPTQLISSQITLMKSLQKYFDYEMEMCGCGIKAIEMRGTEADWTNLQVKLKKLRDVLNPVENILHLSSHFDIANIVYANLLKTYKDGPSMKDWWADILIQGKAVKYGPSGMRRGEVDAYNGWFVEFITGLSDMKLKQDELAKGSYNEVLCGVSSCPMKVTDGIRKISDNSVLLAGIMGYKVHDASTTPNQVTTLEPAHGWVMMLPQNSLLRAK